VQEVQSCSRTNATELHETRDKKEALELVIEQVKFETKEGKESVEKIEQ
jgi:hypothetical protein